MRKYNKVEYIDNRVSNSICKRLTRKVVASRDATIIIIAEASSNS